MIPYDMPLFRPPAEAQSVIVQVTLGCSYNRCAFCSMYKDKKFQERSLEAIFADIDAIALTFPNARRVFLADGDALVMPTNTLVAILEYLHKAFPTLARVSTYASIQNLLEKSVEELELLRAHKLSLLYVGIETGSQKLLDMINKGAQVSDVKAGFERASAARMKVSATVILGLGGQALSHEHVHQTAKLINEVEIRYLATLQLGLEESRKKNFFKGFEGKFLWQDDEAILEEQREFIKALNPVKPVVFRSNHASNALALAGNLPKDKKRLISEIEYALDHEELLRPDYMRGF